MNSVTYGAFGPQHTYHQNTSPSARAAFSPEACRFGVSGHQVFGQFRSGSLGSSVSMRRRAGAWRFSVAKPFITKS